MRQFILVLLSLAILTACSDFNKDNSTKKSDPGTEIQEQEQNIPRNPFPNGELPKPNEQIFSQENMMLNLGLNLVTPWTRQLAKEATRLKLSIDDLCEISASGNSLPAAREQWKKAALVWARLESVNFGPARDLGDWITLNIHPWPNDSQCGVDTMVVDAAVAGKVDGRVIFSRRGLPAIEHLLFDASDRTVCPRQTPAMTAWLTKTEPERKADRCRVLKYLAGDFENQTKLLAAHWDVEKGNYTKTWASDAADKRMAVNLLSDSLFHIEKLKDRKLAIPLGLSAQCPQSSCPEMVESPAADEGLPLIVENLKALQAVFYGHELAADAETAVGQAPYGFDDFLVSKDRKNLAIKIALDLKKSLALAEQAAAKGGLRSRISDMNGKSCGDLCELHTSIRDLARSLKTEFLSVLDLRPPRTIEGDND